MIINRSRLLIFALSGLLLAAGCGQPSYAPAEADPGSADYEPITIENCGQTQTFTAPPQRIVGLYPGQTEILIRLGVADRIIAQAQDGHSEPDPELVEQLRAIPSISTDTPPSRERLLEVTPDFVFSGSEYEFKGEMGFATREQLDESGVNSYVATAGCLTRRSAGTVEDAFADLDQLGAILGVSDRAAELEQEARAELARIEETLAGKPRPRVAQVYVEGGTLSAIGGAIEIDMLQLAGGDNVFRPDEGRFADFYAAEVSPEVVLDRNPEAFVFAVTSDDHERQTKDWLRKTFAETEAVRQDRLIAVRNSTYSPGSLSAIEGIRTITEGLHR